jgi:hypothetical protein
MQFNDDAAIFLLLYKVPVNGTFPIERKFPNSQNGTFPIERKFPNSQSASGKIPISVRIFSQNDRKFRKKTNFRRANKENRIVVCNHALD